MNEANSYISKRLLIMIAFIVVLFSLCIYSDPRKIGEVHKKAYLITDLGGNDNTKFANAVVFHRFVDKDSNIYNIRSLEHEGQPALEYGDSVILNYKIMQGRLVHTEIRTDYVDYEKCKP